MELTSTKAVLYRAGTHRKTPLFRYSRSVTARSAGVIRSETRFTDMSGKLVYFETADLKDGKILRYEWNHQQMGESGNVEIKNGKSFYTLCKGEKTQKEIAEAPENLVIGPSIITYAQDHWKELKSGSSVDVRIGVPDRMNDYGFRFSALKQSDSEKSDKIQISLSPTSPFVAAAVKPIIFTFSKNGTHLLMTEGMSLLKVMKNGKWDDLIAETVFK
ncbi:MAG: hypothetical protein H7301_06620 [Cryobacterium sp.]|nr:hypothetical protein [Oligoflexia bacterium]